MRHCDEDTLAAIALGDPVSTSDAEHAATCVDCAAGLVALRDLLVTIPAAGAVELVAPPARVWHAIRDETAADHRGPSTVAPEPRPSSAGGSAGGNVVELAQRRRRANPWLVGVAAAAAGAVLGAVGVTALGLGDEPAATLVAQAGLADLATEADAGEARVERREDGTEVLVIDTTYTAADGALEVWLIDTDVQGMVSLGFLTGDHGEFEIPAGYAVEAFPIVDISVEPADGDPTHSGDSITRGILS